MMIPLVVAMTKRVTQGGLRQRMMSARGWSRGRKAHPVRKGMDRAAAITAMPAETIMVARSRKGTREGAPVPMATCLRVDRMTVAAMAEKVLQERGAEGILQAPAVGGLTGAKAQVKMMSLPIRKIMAGRMVMETTIAAVHPGEGRALGTAMTDRRGMVRVAAVVREMPGRKMVPVLMVTATKIVTAAMPARGALVYYPDWESRAQRHPIRRG